MGPGSLLIKLEGVSIIKLVGRGSSEGVTIKELAGRNLWNLMEMGPPANFYLGLLAVVVIEVGGYCSHKVIEVVEV